MKSIERIFLAGIGVCLIFAAPVGIEGAHARALPTKDEVKNEVQKSLVELIPVSNSSKGFKLKYPKTWEELEPKEGPIVCKFKTFDGLVSARLAVDELPAGTTLDAYSTATLAQVKAAMASQHMPITVVGESSTEIAAVAARKTIYTYAVEGTPLTAKVMQILVVRNGKGYVFNYTAANDSLYEDFQSVIAEVVKSIEWF